MMISVICFPFMFLILLTSREKEYFFPLRICVLGRQVKKAHLKIIYHINVSYRSLLPDCKMVSISSEMKRAFEATQNHG